MRPQPGVKLETGGGLDACAFLSILGFRAGIDSPVALKRFAHSAAVMSSNRLRMAA